MSVVTLGGLFTFPGTSLMIQRIGYGAMQLAGPGVWGPPKDPDGAIAVLREAVAAGVNHIDTSDFYGPHITNQIIRQALHRLMFFFEISYACHYSFSQASLPFRDPISYLFKVACFQAPSRALPIE